MNDKLNRKALKWDFHLNWVTIFAKTITNTMGFDLGHAVVIRI